MKNRLLEEMFKMWRWEKLIEKADCKGIDKGFLRKMCMPEVRLQIYQAIVNEQIEFSPPRMQLIPKNDKGEFRTVFIGEDFDRCLQSLINDCLFDLFPEMIHKSCKSYQQNLGTGKVVKEFSYHLCNTNASSNGVVAIKSDFHHYFDDICIESIMNVFDTIESKLGFSKGTEPVMNLLRKSWSNNLVFDTSGNLIEQYMGIRQGNAIGSYLADVILYDLDEFMCNKYKFYCRYSDDCMTIHNNVSEVINDMNRIISKHGITLNPKKVEPVYKDKWVKFLGFNIKGNQITLSKSRVKSFQKEIETLTKGVGKQKAINKINRYLYIGDGEFSWATSVLPIINVQKDIDTLNTFVMDAIRACETGKRKIGGLGSVNDKPDYTILRGTGKNVTANRNKTAKEIDGYYSLNCMRNALLTDKGVYEMLVREL